MPITIAGVNKVVTMDTIYSKQILMLLLKQTSHVFRGCDITYVPVFLGGIMKATGNRPPLEIKSGLFSHALIHDFSIYYNR